MKKTRTPRYKPREIIAQIPGTMGIRQRLAQKIGVKWATIDKYCRRYPSIRKAMANERQRTLDDCETVLNGLALTDRNFNAVKFILQTIGRSRGYDNQVTLTTPEEKPVTIKLDLSGFSEEDLRRIDRAIED